MENEKVLLIVFLTIIFILSISIAALVYYTPLHYAKRLKKANKLLRKILTMQGCVDCQNLLPCNKHGDLVEVIYEIEKFLEQKNKIGGQMNLYSIKIREDVPDYYLQPGETKEWSKYIIAPDLSQLIEFYELMGYPIVNIELVQDDIDIIEPNLEFNTNDSLTEHSKEYKFVSDYFEKPSPNDEPNSIELLSIQEISEHFLMKYYTRITQKVLINLYKALEILNFEKIPILVDYGNTVVLWRLKKKNDR